MKLSKDTRREPTHTKSLQNSYAVALRKLFQNYKKAALESLEQSRQLQAETKINIVWLSDRLRDLGAALITNPGKNVVDDYVSKDYKAGATYSGMALKRVGITTVIGEGPADWRAIDTLKVRNLSALRGISDEMGKQIMEELTVGIQEGEGIPELAERIRDRVDSIGITRATIMARTETIYSFNQAAELRYSQHGIEKLEWLVARDERLCPQCEPLDGEQFAIDSNHERPPLHPACRCTIIPVLL